MKLRTVAAAAALVLFLTPSLSAGAGSPYVSGLLGYTIAAKTDAGDLSDISFNDFVSVAAAAGLEYPVSYSRIRFEVELSYRQNEMDEAKFLGTGGGVDGHVSALAVLANAYYGIDTGTTAEPYFLVGGGGSWTSIRDAEFREVKVVDDDGFQFAFQVGGGVGFDLTEKMVLDVGYRYFSTAKSNFEDEDGQSFDFWYRTHTLFAGLRYKF